MGKVYSKTCLQAGESKTYTCEGVNILDLHEDAVIEIFKQLDIKSLCRVAQSCRQMRDIAYNPVLWRECTVDMSRVRTDMVSEETAVSLQLRDITSSKFSAFQRHSSKRKRKRRDGSELKTRIISNGDVNIALHTCQGLASSLTTMMLSLQDYKSFDYQSLVAYQHLRQLVLVACATEILIPVEALPKLLSLTELTITSNYIVNQHLRHKCGFYYLLVHCQDKFPNLKDLTAESLCHFDCPYETLFLNPNSENFSISPLERLCTSVEVIQYYNRKVTGFPLNILLSNLKHLELHDVFVCDEDRMTKTEPIEWADSIVGGLKNLQSLKLTVERDCVPNTPILIGNVEAISLVASVIYDIDITMFVQCTCNLKVLEMDVTTLARVEKGGISEPGLLRVLRYLNKLEILILSREKICCLGDELKHSILQNDSLISVLGVEFEDISQIPNNIQFLTRASPHHKLSQLLKKTRGKGWTAVDKYTAVWHQAYGTAHFYPPSSIHKSFGIIRNYVIGERYINHEKP